MTSQNSSTDVKQTAKPVHIGALLLNTLKRKWTTMLLISIIMFFVLPVPLMMVFSANAEHYARYPESLINMTEEWSFVIRYALVPILSVLAVVMSCVMQRYLHRKVSVDFYHSLPIKRGKLFASQLVSGYLILLIPTVVMFVIALIVITANGGMNGNVMTGSLVTLGEGIVYSLLFYGLASLVGVVTGVTAVHLILTAVAIFIVPIIYAVSVSFCGIFVENMWDSWYLGEKLLSKLSPVLNFIINAETDRTTPLQVVLYLSFAAAFFALAYIVYRHYKSERAEISVIFPSLGEVIKYLVLFPATLGGGLIFYYMMDSGWWTVFGMICGGVLTFMLANTILNKSAKAMFRGWKGLCVYAGVFAVLMVMLFNDAFGINSQVKFGLGKVEVAFEGDTRVMTFTEDETMEALRQFNNKKTGDSKDWGDYRYDRYLAIDGKDVSFYVSDSLKRIKLRVVYYPKFGLPIAKELWIYNKSDYESELRTLLDSREFSEQYAKMWASVSTSEGDSYFDTSYCMTFDDKVRKNYVSTYKFSELSPVKVRNALAADTGNVNFDTFQQLSFGFLNTACEIDYEHDGVNWSDRWLRIPLTPEKTNLLELLYEAKSSNIRPEDYLKEYAKAVGEVTVYDLETDEKETFNDPRDVLEILGSLTAIGQEMYGADYCQFTLNDPRYLAIYSLEYYDGETAAGISKTEYVCAFRLGKVPAFVTD